MSIINFQKDNDSFKLFLFNKAIFYRKNDKEEVRNRFLCFRWKTKKNNILRTNENGADSINHKQDIKFKKVRKQKKPDVSIIIPVYNAEKYIEKCINSLINQTDNNLEFIFINDCSSDNSLNILKECEDSRIKIINLKHNVGVATARNIGLSVAKGEYVGFVDPDDYVDLTYFGHLYRKGRINNADIVMTTSISKIAEDEKIEGKKFSGTNKKGENLRQRDRMRIALTTGITWNKIYKSDFLLKKLILFPEIKTMGTDNYITIIGLLLANKVLVTDEVKYYYRTNPNSIIRKKKDESYFRLVDVYNRILTRIENENIDENLRNEWRKIVEYRAINDFISNLNGFDSETLKLQFINYVKEGFHTDLLIKTDPIISLTSYPARINSVDKTIKSLKNQNFRYQKIILWLSSDQFKNEIIPNNLQQLEDTKFEIRWIRGDIRSYKKLIPALKEFKDEIIVTADDDVIYPSDWLRRLIVSYIQDPNCIHTLRGRKILLDKNSKLSPYSKWRLIKQPLFPEFSILPTGVGGCLYKRTLLHSDITNVELFQTIAPDADDIWFWACALRKGTKIKVANSPLNQPVTIDGTQETALWNTNSNNNDKIINSVIDAYPTILKTLREEQNVQV